MSTAPAAALTSAPADSLSTTAISYCLCWEQEENQPGELNRSPVHGIWRIFGLIGHQGTVLLAMPIDWFLMRVKDFMLCFLAFMFNTTALQFKVVVVWSDHPAFTVHRYFCFFKM